MERGSSCSISRCKPTVSRAASVLELYTRAATDVARDLDLARIDGRPLFAKAVSEGATYQDLFAGPVDIRRLRARAHRSRVGRPPRTRLETALIRRMSTTKPARGRWIQRCALALVAPLCFLGLAELAVVASGFRYPALKSPISLPLPEGEVDGRFLHERDAHELWRPVAGAVVPWGRDTINADGMRGPAVARAKAPGVVRIAALGDSSTFGFGVHYESVGPVGSRLARNRAACAPRRSTPA